MRPLRLMATRILRKWNRAEFRISIHHQKSKNIDMFLFEIVRVPVVCRGRNELIIGVAFWQISQVDKYRFWRFLKRLSWFVSRSRDSRRASNAKHWSPSPRNANMMQKRDEEGIPIEMCNQAMHNQKLCRTSALPLQSRWPCMSNRVQRKMHGHDRPRDLVYSRWFHVWQCFIYELARLHSLAFFSLSTLDVDYYFPQLIHSLL
jgi:hypothetical protein